MDNAMEPMQTQQTAAETPVGQPVQQVQPAAVGQLVQQMQPAGVAQPAQQPQPVAIAQSAQAAAAAIAEYTTFPKRFISYRWFKPILVALVVTVLFIALAIPLVALASLADYVGGTNVLMSMGYGYDDLDTYTAAGAIVSLGGIAIMIPALALAALIVRDRPFSSYSSSRGGWDFRVFFKCLGVAAVTVALPILIFSLASEGVTGPVKFTVVGFILCTVLGPLQCIAEEYLFRGLLLQTFGSWFRFPAIAIALSALVFASQHPYDLTGVIEIFLTGVAFGVIVWYTKGLEASSALHIANNMTIFYCTGFGVGAISSEVDIVSTIFSLSVVTVYILVLVFLGGKRGWFGHVKRDIVTPYNAKVQMKRDQKAAQKAMKAAAAAGYPVAQGVAGYPPMSNAAGYPAAYQPAPGQVGQPGYAAPAQPGYTPVPGQMGYPTAQAQMGYVAPPTQPGYAAPVQQGYAAPAQSGYAPVSAQPGYAPTPTMPAQPGHAVPPQVDYAATAVPMAQVPQTAYPPEQGYMQPPVADPAAVTPESQGSAHDE